MSISEEEVSTSVGGSVGRRRRQWSEAQKRQIVAETHEPGVSVPMVAQRYNLNANQIFGKHPVEAAKPAGLTGWLQSVCATGATTKHPTLSARVEAGGDRLRSVC